MLVGRSEAQLNELRYTLAVKIVGICGVDDTPLREIWFRKY
jgi:hypothetical protein